MVADVILLSSLVVAGLVSGMIFALSAWVYRRRNTRTYLLLTVALGALAARSLVGLSDVFGLISHSQHHILEHVLDVVIALCLFVSIIAMGRPDPLASEVIADD